MKEEFVQLSVASEEAQPLLDQLFAEYDEIYGSFFEGKGPEVLAQRAKYHHQERYEGTDDYLPEHGGLFIVLKRNDEVIAMGAYKKYDDETAELKRIWSHRQLRKQGLAAKVVYELERRAYEAGYRKIHLSTGFRQIPAVKLYLSLGYEPQFEIPDDWNFERGFSENKIRSLPFKKTLKQGEVA
ncbi:MAG: GNAT family N-acetyltransferase [Acinetobacter sp.]